MILRRPSPRPLHSWLLLASLAIAPLAADEAPKEAPKPLTPAQLYQQSLPSVLTLKVKYADDTDGSGSGFLAVKDGCAITAWHMVRNASKVTAKFSDGQEFEVSGVVDRDEKRDLALIRVKVAARPMLTLSPTDPPVGEKAYAIGAPQGLEFSLSDGLISQVRTEEGVKSYQFTCPISPGNSGGPLMLENGQVAGVVNARRLDGQNLNFAVPGVYALGLDASLPTKPWEQLIVPEKPEESTTPPSEERLSLAIQAAYEALLDVPAVIDRAEDEIIAVEAGYRQGVPVYLSDVQLSATESWLLMAKFVSLKVSNPLLIPLQEALRLYVNALDLYAEGIEDAEKKKGWTKEAGNLITQGRSVYISGSAAYGAVNTALDSSELTKEARAPLLRSWGQVTDSVVAEIRWESGICMLASDPMVVFRIKPDSWAQKLELQEGDRIVSVDKTPLYTLYEVKKYLEKKVGNVAAITVERMGKEEVLSRKIPSIKKVKK